MKLLEIIRKIRKLTNKQSVRLSDRKVLNASEIIEVACKSKGFTPKQIADLCGKTPSTISKWKSKVGESAGYLPTEVQLAPLADSIGIVMELEPIPSVPKKPPRKTANLISSIILFALIGFILWLIMSMSLEAKSKFGTYNFAVFGNVVEERQAKYKELCNQNEESCIERDK
ncbi:conserved hypothetical protein [Vibrio chagasii]|nr:conserved hypothetical protein [Vibrio chagasii]